ncbi:MAG: hypothetical protein CMJ34_13125 [Phycisphaerae bacterium]|nr:hypothetical protein [Phycisphaerae bacterium]
MRSMSRSLLLAGLLGILSSGALCLPASGQALDREIVTTTRPLTAAQASMVADFANAQLSRITEGDAANLIEARDTIIQDARRPGVTGVFLRAYSTALVPGIRTLLDKSGTDDELFPLRAENSLRILAFLRTPDSVDLLVSASNPSRVSDRGQRLVAAGLVPLAVEPVPQSGLNSGALTGLARELSNNLRDENDWLVVLEDLRAMNAIALNPGMTRQNRSEVRSMQFEAYADLADRVEKADQPSELVFSIHRAMLGLRDRLLANATASDVSNKQIAQTLRNMLTTIGNAAVKQWDGLQKSSKMYAAYEGTLRIGAQLLSLLDGRPDDAVDALATPMTEALKTRPDGPARDKALANLKSALKKLD